MSDDDKTPVDGRSTLEMVLDEVRDVKAVMNRNHDLQLIMYEEHKRTMARVASLENRVWVPALVCVLSALFCLASVVVR